MLNNPEFLRVPRAPKNPPNDAVLHGRVVRQPVPVGPTGIADGPYLLSFYGWGERQRNRRQSYIWDIGDCEVEFLGRGDYFHIVQLAGVCWDGLDRVGVGNDVGIGRNITLVVYGKSSASTRPLAGLGYNAYHALFKRGKVWRSNSATRQQKRENKKVETPASAAVQCSLLHQTHGKNHRPYLKPIIVLQ